LLPGRIGQKIKRPILPIFPVMPVNLPVFRLRRVIGSIVLLGLIMLALAVPPSLPAGRIADHEQARSLLNEMDMIPRAGAAMMSAVRLTANVTNIKMVPVVTRSVVAYLPTEEKMLVRPLPVVYIPGPEMCLFFLIPVFNSKYKDQQKPPHFVLA